MCPCVNIFGPLLLDVLKWAAKCTHFDIGHLIISCMCFYNFLNQARAGLWPVRTWFLEITFIPPVYVCVCVCACVCVHPRGYK